MKYFVQQPTIILKHLFNLSVFLYFATYLLPFAEGFWGYEIEFEMWNSILGGTIVDMEVATIWSFRCLTNVLILGLWWLATPEVRYWFSIYTDKALLDKLLLIVLLVFVCYPFFFERMNWEWGGLLWGVVAIVVGFSYQMLETPVIKEEKERFKLVDHLVELKESHK